MEAISGFSKLNKAQKKALVVNESWHKMIESFDHPDQNIQKVIDEFSENTLANFPIPFGVIPNVMINGEIVHVPMAIEESSVVAAASRAANFWLKRGGFHTEILGTTKLGHVHFLWNGPSEKLFHFFLNIKSVLIFELQEELQSMEKRGGGLLDLQLIEKGNTYYKIEGCFETVDAMGANFINTIMELVAEKWKEAIAQNEDFSIDERKVSIIMSILTNYTPDCLVKASVECSVDELAQEKEGMTGRQFAEKFCWATYIAKNDVHRAVTHNKGIFNGVDGVIVATGNDYRACEAQGHAYAARDGVYRSLSDAEITADGNRFKFTLTLPLSIGTVGGLTSLHPLSQMSLEMLGNPNAKKLMEIVAAVGLAQNFAAVSSLITSGIQKGHMKMHLMNILNHLEATDTEREKVKLEFKNKIISHKKVREFLSTLRS